MLLKIAKKYHVHGSEGLPPSLQVVPHAMLNAIRSSDQIVKAAESTSQDIIRRAHEQAGVVAFEAACDAQRAVWLSASQTLQELERLQSIFLEEVKTKLHEVIEDAFRQLLLDIPDTQKITSSIHLVLKDWNTEKDAVLHVHPDDYPVVHKIFPPHLPCKLISDPAIHKGSCTLTTGGVVLQSTFDSNVENLLAAIQSVD